MFDPSFDELEQLACGELGLKINEFYDLTPRQFFNIIKGTRTKEEREERKAWERSRMVMYYTLLPHTSKKELQPKDLMVFPWEEHQEETRKPMDKKELQKYFKSTE